MLKKRNQKKKNSQEKKKKENKAIEGKRKIVEGIRLAVKISFLQEIDTVFLRKGCFLFFLFYFKQLDVLLNFIQHTINFVNYLKYA